MEKIKHLILGAGPAGIAAALRLGKDASIVERSSFIGGQSASLQIGEAVFDIGGHSFHTPHPFVRDLVYNSLEMFDQTRKAYCYSYDTLIPYPFQKHFREINNERVVRECADGLSNKVASNEPAENFRDFILDRFGIGIAEHFMLPYNEKLWARDLTLLDAQWVGERVAAPEGVREKFEQEGGQRKPLQADTTVGYPAQGGFGEIYTALSRQVHDIRLNTEIVQIDPKNKRAYTRDGKIFEYHRLISTLPINELLQIVIGANEEVRNDVNTLQYMSLKCVLVAVNHPVDTEIQRIYSADEDNPAHKTAINHNSSDWLRSRPHHGIMGEVSYSPYKQMSRPDVEAWFIESLIKMHIIQSRDEILGAKVIDVKYAYPVPTHNRRSIMDSALAYLRELDIYSLGRFGEWAYINSDETLARGLILGEQLAGQ